MTNVAIEDEHLNFSSLDTLDQGDVTHEHIAVRSESSGNSSSSTTNDRSVLCRISNTLSKATPGVVSNNRTTTVTGNFGTVGRRHQVITTQIAPANPPAPPKKPMAPKPPAPPNIVVISATAANKNDPRNSHYVPSSNVSTVNGKSPCINNIYIDSMNLHNNHFFSF